MRQTFWQKQHNYVIRIKQFKKYLHHYWNKKTNQALQNCYFLFFSTVGFLVFVGLPVVHDGGSLAGKDWAEASSTSFQGLSFSALGDLGLGLHVI